MAVQPGIPPAKEHRFERDSNERFPDLTYAAARGELIPTSIHRFLHSRKIIAGLCVDPSQLSAYYFAVSSMIGSTVSHCRIMEVLGTGGLDVVYKAEDLKFRRPLEGPAAGFCSRSASAGASDAQG